MEFDLDSAMEEICVSKYNIIFIVKYTKQWKILIFYSSCIIIKY
jgi:hypothetical protein